MRKTEVVHPAQSIPELDTALCGEKSPSSPHYRFAKKIATGIALTTALTTAAVGGSKSAEYFFPELPEGTYSASLEVTESLHDTLSYGKTIYHRLREDQYSTLPRSDGPELPQIQHPESTFCDDVSSDDLYSQYQYGSYFQEKAVVDIHPEYGQFMLSSPLLSRECFDYQTQHEQERLAEQTVQNSQAPSAQLDPAYPSTKLEQVNLGNPWVTGLYPDPTRIGY